MNSSQEKHLRGKMKKIVRIVLIFLGVIGIILLFGLGQYIISDDSKTYSFLNVEGINTNLENAEIHIETVQGKENKTHIEVVAKGKSMTNDIYITNEGNSVNIDQKSMFRLGIFGNLKIIVKVEVKENQFDHLNLSNESGAISIKHANSNNITIQTESGDVSLDDISTKNTSVSSSSAKISLGNITNSNKLEIKTQSGAITLKDVESKELSIQSSSGSQHGEEIVTSNLTTQSDSGSGSYEFSEALVELNADSKSSSGNIEYIFQNDIPLDINWSGKKMKNQITNDKNATNKINMKTNSGNMSVKRK
ncbi:DUF4097 family beta strand repeat-containing protein [Niallia sp.]|uniref:DUF4097 family beta strand repeat-containing protein n=1 Tax=Niallia sp. TaxID=2837523 RepID=UPI0028967188|nr:DUF4097 family beta strand repeat-containing protein [Niallia sp.]